MKKTTQAEKTDFSRDEIDQILGAWGEAMRRKYPPPPKAEPRLQVAPPEGQAREEHYYAHRGLTITWNSGSDCTTVRFAGHSEQWADRLLHAHWTWTGQSDDEHLSCFILLPKNPFNGKYFTEISLPGRICHLPDWMSIDLAQVSPTKFAREWKKAQVKPDSSQMQDWVSRQPEGARKKWKSVLSKLEG